MPPELLLERAGGPDAGNPEVAEMQRQLSALRELALLMTAELVDRQLEDYLLAHGIGQRWGTQERVLVYLTPGADAEAMIASGKRNAERFHGEFYAVCVQYAQLSANEESDLQNRLKAAERAGAQVAVLESDDPVEALMDFARLHGITQIFLGNTRRQYWWNHWIGSPVDRLIRAAEGIDVRVFPD